jgi:uncharacterized protein
MPVRMELSRILIRELDDTQVIELREVADIASESTGDGEESPTGVAQKENGRSFPIVIGLPEAQAIERRLKGITIKRPQTHDLLASIITQLGATLESIAIVDLAEHTFFARLNIRTKEGTLLTLDSRPSDAIALGIAGGVPLYVAEHVLAAASKDEGDAP